MRIDRIPLATARRWAEKTVEWLAPAAERIEICGSIRRGRPTCGDIDLVVIPKWSEDRDLLGATPERTNLTHRFLVNYVAGSKGDATIQSGGDRPGDLMIVQLRRCQLDVFFADRQTLATRVLCRTGSLDHNIWLAERAHNRGLHWNPSQGVYGLNDPAKAILPSGSEADLYGYFGLTVIEPEHREIEWLRANIDGGLE